jgi:hypothetical protein
MLITHFSQVGMGIEFQVRLPNLDADKCGEILRSAPFYSDYDASHEFFNFRDPARENGGWPELWAKLDTDGIYLCHNGSRAVFEAVVDHIRQNICKPSEELCIEEL